MKIWLALLIMIVMVGCTQMQNATALYEVRMLDGSKIYAKNKPNEDEDGYLRFKDVNDQSYIIRENLVLYVERAEVKK